MLDHVISLLVSWVVEVISAAGYLGVVVLMRQRAPVRSAPGRRRVEALARVVASDPAVARVFDLYNTHNAAFVSADG